MKSVRQPSFPKRDMDLYGRDRDSISLEKFPWGMYDVGVVEGTYRTPLRLHEGLKVMLMAGASNETTDAALYLTDRNRPLSLAGQTLIKGNAYLPQSGVKRANVNGMNFMGERLIEGGERRSKRRLPKLDTNRVNHLLSFFDGRMGISSIPKRIRQSFADSTVFITGQNLLLERYDLSGNIVVQASEAIHISEDCRLEDVIIVAPSISIDDNFNGNLQAIAIDEISLGENVSLSHPSSLVLFRTGISMEKPEIILGNGSLVHGSVLIHDSHKRGDGATLYMEENSIVNGMAYVDGSVELKGRIMGHISLKSFYLKTASTTYDNYLFNASIDRTALSEDFLFPPILDGTGGNEIVKSLY